MTKLRLLLGLAFIASLAAVSSAQDAREDQSPPTDEAEREAAEDIFIPTEEIPADQEVTFPVDI